MASIAAAAAAAICVLSTSPASIAAPETPYSQANNTPYGVTPRGTVYACPTTLNGNCVSTASNNDTYAPAWRATERDAAAAAKVRGRLSAVHAN